MIELKKYRVQVRNRLLFEIDNWQIEEGKVYYLLGKNGSGKSTFLRSLMEVKQSDYLLDGKPISDWTPKEVAQRIAYVSSKLNTNEYTTVAEFLLMGRYPYGKLLLTNTVEDEQQIEEALDMLNLNALRNQKLSELSDGQQQLVSIGRAIAQNVNYLLLDEPTAFLDYKNKRWVFELVHRVATEKNMGIIVVTHDISYPFENSEELYAIQSNEKSIQILHPKDFTSIDKMSEVIY